MNPNRGELKSLVHAVNPDLLCFLEANINSQKLFEIQGFEEWATQSGFAQLICYWSIQEGKAAYGGEGILIFTKVPCEVSYGIGDPDSDRQARVLTLDFPKILMVVSYNPQGGFSEESLDYRTRWHKSFLIFLKRLREGAEKYVKRHHMGRRF